MANTTMPAAEATVASTHDAEERVSYELAFHVLPTVAEGEVSRVFGEIKDIITKDGGEIFDEENAERIDLAYEIVQHLEGKNRKFSSAYFGWIRFRSASEAVLKITSEVDHHKNILRYLLVRLTRVEEAHPFKYHEAMGALKMVKRVGADEVDAEEKEDAEGVDTADIEESDPAEVAVEVSDDAIDEALEKKEV